MGMPLQEKFITQALKHVRFGIWLPCGGWLDVYSGMRKDVPPWAPQLGLSWFFRLLTDPRRVWRRYSIEALAVAMAAAKERFGLR